MKKLMFILLLVSVANIFAQSPVSKGHYSVDGSISYSHTTSDDYSNDYFNFSPNVGYFFVDNLFAGLSINFYNRSDDNSSSQSYGVGPTLRYYFHANEKLKPFVGLNYNYTWYEDDLTSGILTFRLGSDYFITNSFAIEGSIGYSLINFHQNSVYYSSDSQKQFNILFGVNYFIQ